MTKNALNDILLNPVRSLFVVPLFALKTKTHQNTKFLPIFNGRNNNWVTDLKSDHLGGGCSIDPLTKK